MSPRFLIALLAGASPAPLLAQPGAPLSAPGDAAVAADAAQQPLEEEDEYFDEEDIEGESIVVTGQRLRGAVDTDIPPEVQLDRRDIRATGAGSVAELLDAIAPQTRSGRGRGGGRPVILLNGRRISGFREIRDLPPEAIQRVDIMPEEVALRYGYRADQRVVNIVLRRRFRAITGEIEGGFATAGGRGSYETDLNLLRIDRAGRWSLDFEYQHDDPLFESERDVIQSATAPPGIDLGDFRTLLAESDQLELGGTLNRTAFGDVSATVTSRLELESRLARLGHADTDRPLTRDTDTRTGHLGFVLNGDVRPWRWSLTGNYENVRTASETETRPEDGGVRGLDRTRSTSSVGSSELVMSGPVIDLPAGDVSATVRAGFDSRDFSGTTLRRGVEQGRELSRDRGSVQGSVDIPVASRRTGVLEDLGNLSFNLNAELERLSDFGTLATWGGGLNWSPIEELNFGVNYTNEDGAPSMQQLGDPVQLTPNVRVFDFVRQETVDIGRLEGGSPDLVADNRRVLTLRMNARPLEDEDLSILVNYTSSRTRNPIASFPTATAEIEAAFPERFERDADGRLLRIDARPVNFARSDRSEIRWGIDFSEPIGPQGPPGGFRGRFGGGRVQGAPGAERPPQAQPQQPPPEGSQPRQQPAAQQAPAQPQQSEAERPRGSGAAGRGGFRGGGGRGGFGGGRGGGRLQLGLFHTLHLENEILIREGLPVLDLLDGSAVGSRGGQSRHEVELQAGIFRNGLGARLSGNWQSGTIVRGTPDPTGGTSGDLFFGDHATVNLRLFADLGAQRSLVREVPFLRGSRVSVAIDNLFDSRLDVRDEAGNVPLGYQPDLLDPLGRSVRITFRKLFF